MIAMALMCAPSLHPGRRAHHGARRHHPGADPAPARRAAARIRHGPRADHARPRHRRPHRHARRRHVRRRGGRDRHRRRRSSRAPAHPYTQGLLACIPVPGRTRRGDPLGTIPGMVPSLVGETRGCHFAGRCPHAIDVCRALRHPARGRRAAISISCAASATPRSPRRPAGGSRRRRCERVAGHRCAVAGQAPLLEARSVSRTFQVSAGLLRAKRTLPAVEGVSLAVRPGEVVALVGESGCGKTTLARMLLGLLPPSAGEIRIDGRPTAALARREIARLVQPVFQDPYSSLNPRKSIGSIIALPLRVQGDPKPETWRARVEEMMERVGLARRLYDNYPSQLSGGQRQRVAIARALINRPRMVICDEPTSALDVSVQSQILNLLQDLRRDLGLTYLLISHNLAVVEHMATRVAVMYLGRIVEEADTDTFSAAPKHPYSEALLASVLTPEPGLGVPDTHLGAAYPNPLEVPPGCRFHPRCALCVMSAAVSRRSRLPARRLRRMSSLRPDYTCRDSPHDRRQEQEFARRCHRARPRLCRRAAPSRPSWPAASPSRPRARCCPPACPSCTATSTRRWRPPSRAWASRRASTTTRCRARGRCCSPPASRMPSCRPCSATATATSSAASRTSGPRARVRGSPRATATGSTAAAPPTTRASTPSTWRRSSACARSAAAGSASTPSSSSRWARRRAPRAWPSWWPRTRPTSPPTF